VFRAGKYGIVMALPRHFLRLRSKADRHSKEWPPSRQIKNEREAFDQGKEEIAEKKGEPPGIETTFYDAKCVQVIDPFGNRIRFNEDLKSQRGSA
jgi:Glyoxalase superfamily protein